MNKYQLSLKKNVHIYGRGLFEGSRKFLNIVNRNFNCQDFKAIFWHVPSAVLINLNYRY